MSQICKVKECLKRAIYNFPGNSLEFCKLHKSAGMINVVSKRCENKKCEKLASYGILLNDKIKVTHCFTHATSNMESNNLKFKKCKFDGCNTTSTYGLVVNGKVKITHCSTHASNEMESNKKKCLYNGCNTIPSYGLTDGSPTHCSSHADHDNMIDINNINKLCIFAGCSIRATLGIKDKNPTHCSTHADHKTMVNNHKKCIFEGCLTEPSFGPDKNNRIYCAKHNNNKYNDVSNKKCIGCGLTQVRKETNYLCAYCNPIKVRNALTKENKVRDLLLKNNYNFIHNKQFTNECCLKYRPDFLFECSSYYIVLEVDEGAHKQYDKECEIIRMNNISTGLGLPTLFIRYNPDHRGYKVVVKQQTLLDTLDKYLDMEFLEDLTPIYLYYP